MAHRGRHRRLNTLDSPAPRICYGRPQHAKAVGHSLPFLRQYHPCAEGRHGPGVLGQSGGRGQESAGTVGDGPARRVPGRFDADPDAYDRTRPVAPDAVFDDTMRLAGLRSGSTVLEIGPGTGQATRPLAEGGVRILALELGPHLAARARQNLGGFPSVTVRAISFEAWVPGDARPVAMQPAFRVSRGPPAGRVISDVRSAARTSIRW
jgi:hypothetical protein